MRTNGGAGEGRIRLSPVRTESKKLPAKAQLGGMAVQGKDGPYQSPLSVCFIS